MSAHRGDGHMGLYNDVDAEEMIGHKCELTKISWSIMMIEYGQMFRS